MAHESVSIPVIKVKGDSGEFAVEAVAQESPLTLFYNEKEIATVLCSPFQIEELALGFLFLEGFIAKLSDVHSLRYDPALQAVWLSGTTPKISSEDMTKRLFSACCGKSRCSIPFSNDSELVKVQTSNQRYSLQEISVYVRRLQEFSPLFQATGGVHCGGIAWQEKTLLTSYDIGRHNVLDKLAGSALKESVDLTDHVLYFSGRVSSEILLKIAKMNIPVLIARNAPTDMALNLARNLNITVIGFARGDRFNIYTCPERILHGMLEFPPNPQAY